MKTKLYYLMLIILAILMESCVERTPNVSEKSEYIGIDPHGNTIYSFIINDHEYYKIYQGYVHSGTCKKCKFIRDSILTKIYERIDRKD